MKIALAQINLTIGDLDGNSQKIIESAHNAHRRGADLVVFPELALTGYSPQDLLENPAFLDATERALKTIAAAVPPDIGVLLGLPVRNRDRIGKRLYNAAVLLEGGRTVAEVHKSLLPTYDVYDEYRYFEPARERRCVDFRGMRLGIHICEDMWNSHLSADFNMYATDPLAELAADGAELFINLSATPFSKGQHDRRNSIIKAVCSRFGLPFVITSQVGANGEMIFDGDSRVHLADGSMSLCAPSFEESLLIWDMADKRAATNVKHSETADLYRALVLGIRDYYRKSSHFEGVAIGISGGIDSAVTAALAVHAVGAEHVLGVFMPSQYTPVASADDARSVARNLGIALKEMPIESAVDMLLTMVDEPADPDVSIVEENVQSRVRAVALMGISNSSNRLVLSTSNKSEAAVGYTTLYGDMTGGLSVLSDVYKTEVYEVARYINNRSERDVIPGRILEKPPSAELRPGQTDQDALPPYRMLDDILIHFIEQREGLDSIAEATGFDRALIHGILKRVDAAEFKRRQAPPGLRVSRRTFSGGYRMPLVSSFER